MQAVVLVNAAPGFEEAVEASLRKLDGVTAVARVKKENYDFAVLIEVDDEGDVQTFLTSRMRLVTGVQGTERLDSPSPDLIARLAGRG